MCSLQAQVAQVCELTYPMGCADCQMADIMLEELLLLPYFDVLCEEFCRSARLQTALGRRNLLWPWTSSWDVVEMPC